MRRLIENTVTIRGQDAGKTLPRATETGIVELEIVGIGVQEVAIVSTPGRFGGYLRWFLCPGCGRRVGKLYLPAGKYAFLCRHCHRLAYRAQLTRDSRRESKKKQTLRQLDRLELLNKLQVFLKKTGDIPTS